MSKLSGLGKDVLDRIEDKCGGEWCKHNNCGCVLWTLEHCKYKQKAIKESWL